MPATYINIASQTPSTSVNTVTFSSIPSTYTDLVLRWSVRADDTLNAFYLRFNNDASAIYSYTYMSQGSVSGRNSGGTEVIVTGAMDRTDYTANTFSNGELYIPSYTSTVGKPMNNFTVAENNNATAYYVVGQASLYNNTSALNTIRIRANTTFTIGSSFYLYGIKNS